MAGPFDPYHRWLGIPPKDQPPNHYRLLGLQLFEDDPDVIESAADQRMAHLRTFQTGKHSRLSQKLLNEVAAAKLCLLSPQKRAAYDELLRQKLPERAAEAPAPRAAEPVGPELAGLFAQADQGTPAARFRAAARNRSTKLAIVVASAAAVGLLLLGLVFWGGPSTPETALLLDWPEDQRQQATLEIDGKPFAVEPSGPLQHRCPPGEHRIVAARPGFQPFAKTFTLDQGQTKTVRPVWQKVTEPGPPPGPGPLAHSGEARRGIGAVPKESAGVPPDGSAPANHPSGPQAATPWDPTEVGLRGILPREKGEFVYLAFSPDGATLFAGNTSDVGVEYWDVATGQGQGALPGGVACMALSADASLLAFAAGEPQTVKVRKMATGEVRQTRGQHEGSVSALAVSPNGTKVASGGQDKKLMLWDVATGELLWSKQAHEYEPTSLAFRPDGSTLASGCPREKYPGVRLWDVATGAMRKRLSGQGPGPVLGGIRTFAFSPDGSLLASSEVTENAILLWGVDKGRVLRRLQGHAGAVISLAFSLDGATLASGSDDKTLKLWDVTSGELRRTLTGYTSASRCVVFSPDGMILATTDHQAVRFWGPPPRGKR